MRILGIDPGSRVLGFGCIAVGDGRGGGRAALVEAGVVRAGRSDEEAGVRLLRLAQGLEGLLSRLGPDCLALEETFVGRNVSSALRIGEARGVVLACAARAGVPVRQYPPAAIKRAVTGSGAAPKEQVRDLVRLLLGLPPARALPLDASDALAAALCHHFRGHGLALEAQKVPPRA